MPGTAPSQASSGCRTTAPTRSMALWKSYWRFYGLAQVPVGAVVRHSGVQPAMGCAAAIGDPDPNDGPAARFAAKAARYGNGGEPALRSEQALPAKGCAAAPAILSQTTFRSSPRTCWSRRQAANQAARCVRYGPFAGFVGMPNHSSNGIVVHHEIVAVRLRTRLTAGCV